MNYNEFAGVFAQSLLANQEDIMPHSEPSKYPVFVMAGSDIRRRRLLDTIDPEGKYKAKALLPFLGKRLIDWQLEELQKSPYVDVLYLIGLSEEDARFDYPVQYVPAETISDFDDKLIKGLNYLEAQGQQPELIVISSCDAPGIRVEHINRFFELLNQYNSHDFILSLVPEAIGEKEFPHCKRVVARFRGCHVFPGELMALSPRAIRLQQQVIRELSNRRRQINREARKISMGPMLRFVGQRPRTWLMILKYMLGSATLEDAERAVSAAFDCKTKGLIIPDAGFGMDMDLPEDYHRLKDYVMRIKMPQESV